MPENLEASGVMSVFGAVIYSGEGISSIGVQHAMEWSGVHPDRFSITAQKIVLYYSALSSRIHQDHKKDTADGIKKNTNRPKSKRQKRHN